MQRIYYLDNIKFFAILSVVCMHVYELLFINDNIALQIAGRIGVPLFSFVSGILMFPRDYDSNSLVKYFKHTFLPLFVTSEIWIVLWACYNEKSIEDVVRCVLLIDNPCETMWYARMICRLYFVLPFFCMLLHRSKYLFLMIMMGIFFLYSYFYQIDFAWILKRLNLSDTNFMLYLLYMYFGYSFRNLKFNLWYVLAIIVVIPSIYFVLECFHTTLWYNSPLLMLLSIPVFLILKHYFDTKNRVMTLVARYSYGIYLSHMLFVLILYKCGLTISQVFLVPMVSCVVVILTTILIYIFEKLSPRFATVLFRL